MEKELITLEAQKILQERVEYLKNTERPRVVKSLQHARSLGDLSENDEYHTAKKEQGNIEAEIAQIELRLRSATIINGNTKNKDVISIGSVVTVVRFDTRAKCIYTIVGVDEVDAVNGKIAYTSPIGTAVMEHKKDDEVMVTLPAGKVKFQIKKVA